ncbi:MAG: methylmalonyl-CoA mutase family protein [Marmoricola sp.]
MESLSLQTGAGHDRAEWEELAAGVLRRSDRLADDAPASDVWDALTRRTLDGIGVPPLGTPELQASLTTHGRPARAGDWDVRGLFADPDAGATASAISNELDTGVTSVWLRLGDHGIGMDDLATVLTGVLLDIAPVVLDAPEDQLAAAQAFAGLAKGVPLAEGTNLGIDPVGAVLRTGADLPDADTVQRTIEDAAGLARQVGARAFVVDATVVHDLGASDGQELGYAMAVGAAYLRALEAAELDVARAAGLLEFRLAATDEQFCTIAKLRALRRLWDRVLELSGVDADGRGLRLHAVTSRPMMTRHGPWANLLRTCVAGFAAGVAGADAVTVVPFDTRLGMPDAFSRRLARNTSSLLISESHLARVADPAGGSYLVEKLTDDLARAGWAELGRIEESGGPVAALDDGSLRERIARVAEERDRQIARRKRPLTGLSEFPDLHETLPERRPYPKGTPAVRPYGHAFEAMRDEPAEQPVFLATMGPVADHTARATFAANLFAAGGTDVVNEGAHEDTDAVLGHYRGEAVACLTGSDEAYDAWGTGLANALREAGARWVVVAGQPLEGTDDSCATGVDAVAFLTRIRSTLEHAT